MAEQTWWWGKRIDPTTFWRDRPIWHDYKADREARCYGRAYPPMPYNDPTLESRSDIDRKPSFFFIGGIEGGPYIRLVHSERESVFWDKFMKTHPLPPEYIEREQQSYGRNMVGTQSIFSHDPVYGAKLRVKPDTPQSISEAAQYHLKAFNFPNEALSSNALFWAYVLKERERYQEALVNFNSHPSVISNHIRRIKVDQHFITEPMTDEQVCQANAWKIEYLRRLRREGADEAYIIAYLKAWRLEPSQIAGAEK